MREPTAGEIKVAKQRLGLDFYDSYSGVCGGPVQQFWLHNHKNPHEWHQRVDCAVARDPSDSRLEHFCVSASIRGDGLYVDVSGRANQNNWLDVAEKLLNDARRKAMA